MPWPSARRPTPTASAPDRRGLSLGRIVTSEWIKFRSVRATAWTLPITAALMVGLAVLQAWGASTMGPEAFGQVNGVEVITGGWFFAQLAVAVLGVLTITGEYSTGMIRSTLAAVPRRVPALWAKAAVLVVVVFAVSLVAIGLSWIAVQPWGSSLDLGLDLSDGQTARVLLGTPLYLSTIAVFAFAIGALLRHSAGALATVLGLLLVVEQVFASIPLRFFEVVAPFLPSNAGTHLLYSDEMIDMIWSGEGVVQLTPWQGYGVLAAWTLVLLAAAAVLLRRRDA